MVAILVWLVSSFLFELNIYTADSLIQTIIVKLMLPAIGGISVFILCSFLLKINEIRLILLLFKKRQVAINSILGDKHDRPKA